MSKNSKKGNSITSVKSYCESNKDFGKILKLFTEGYTPTYNKRKVKIRKEVQLFLKRNFFTWYYSKANSVSKVSPACFISSHIYHKFGEDFVVMPIPEPVYKQTKLQSINYSFHVFTMDNHPLVKDIEMLVNAAVKTDSLEALIEQLEFPFGKRHYMAFLFNVCCEMGLMTNNTDKRKVNEKKLAEFLALPEKDKLNKILTAHLNGLISSLKKQKVPGKLPTQAKLIKIISASHDTDNFYDELFPGLMTHVADITASILPDLDGDVIDDGDDNAFEKIADSTMELQALISSISSAIFICCGLYFQIIQPEYNSHFKFDELDNDYTEQLSPDDYGMDEDMIAQYKGMLSFLAYIKPHSYYSVTPIGAKLFNKKYLDGLYHPLVGPGEYKKVLKDMLLDRDEIGNDDVFDVFSEIFGDNFFARFNEMDVINSMKKGGIHLSLPHDPLVGLNPHNKPTFTDETKTYRFKVNKEIITIEGNETLTHLGYAIESMFGLDDFHLSAFYMGTKFFEESREIQCPEPFSDSGESDNYRICDLNLYKGQTFLYLFDFGAEQRFTLKFDGYEDSPTTG